MPKLNVDVGVDGTRLVRGLKETDSAVKNWSGAIKGYIATAFSVGAIASAMNQTAGYFDNIGNAAERLDIGAASMQTLLRMAQMAGKELGNVEQMMTSIADAQIAAIENPDSAQAKAFARMGLSPQMLNKMEPLDLAQNMAIRTSDMGSGERRQALTDIVGKKNVGMFSAMSGDMVDMENKTKELVEKGIIPSSEAVAQFNQKLDLLTVRWQTLKNKMLGITELFVDVGNALMKPFEHDWSKSKGKGWDGFFDDMVAIFTPTDRDLKKAWDRKNVFDVRASRPDKAPPGPNIEVGTGKEKEKWQLKESERFDFMKGFTKFEPKMSDYVGNASMPMSNFLGSNLGLMSTVGTQTVSLLQKIAQNTKDMKERMEAQKEYDIYMGILGGGR